MPQGKKNLVVGAGLSGAVMARKLASVLGEDVLVIDKNDFLGGMCFDCKDKNGITVNRFGAHIFHTNNPVIWRYLNSFSKFIPVRCAQKGCVEGITTSFPFNLNSIYDTLPPFLAKRLEEKLLKKYCYSSFVSALDFKTKFFIKDNDFDFLANYIYGNIFYPAYKKLYGREPNNSDILKSLFASVYISRDDRYFKESYQGVPEGGYSALIENILNHKNIKTALNTDFKSVDTKDFDRIFYTGPIDEFFNFEYGVLAYRSAEFDFSTVEKEFYQDAPVCYHFKDYDFLKIHEFKRINGVRAEKTVIAKEYVKDFLLGRGERSYAVLSDKNVKMYKMYKDKSKKLKNIYFFGRLGDFKNYSMAESLKRTFELFDAIRFNSSYSEKQSAANLENSDNKYNLRKI